MGRVTSTAAVGHRVVVVGSVNADLVTRVDRHPTPGETVLGDDLTVLPGGKGANQAVAAARLGAPTALVGAVGTDAFAEPALAGLRAAGVDLGALTVVDGPTGLALVTVDAAGENSIVVVPGANAHVDGAHVDAHRETVAAAAVVVVQGEIPRSGTERAAAATRGRLVVNLAPVVDVDPAVLRRADPLVVNEHEAAAVLAALDRGTGAGGTGDEGTGDGSTGTVAPAADEAAVAARLVAHGIPTVVVTRGARGALVGAADGVVAVAAPRVAAVDTTGAGDAFVGALAARLAAGDDLVAAARLAVRVGAAAVLGRGAQPSFPAAGDVLPG
jgi:ribokinase